MRAQLGSLPLLADAWRRKGRGERDGSEATAHPNGGVPSPLVSRARPRAARPLYRARLLRAKEESRMRRSLYCARVHSGSRMRGSARPAAQGKVDEFSSLRTSQPPRGQGCSTQRAPPSWRAGSPPPPRTRPPAAPPPPPPTPSPTPCSAPPPRTRQGPRPAAGGPRLRRRPARRRRAWSGPSDLRPGGGESAGRRLGSAAESTAAQRRLAERHLVWRPEERFRLTDSWRAMVASRRSSASSALRVMNPGVSSELVNAMRPHLERRSVWCLLRGAEAVGTRVQRGESWAARAPGDSAVGGLETHEPAVRGRKAHAPAWEDRCAGES